MTFIGDDGSVLIEELDGFNIKYPEIIPHGNRLSDVCPHLKFTLSEMLWICDMKSSHVDALDVYRLAKLHNFRKERVAAVYQLYSDRELFKILSTNINKMMCLGDDDNGCSFSLVSQAQKHLRTLEQSIQDRENVIHSFVNNVDGNNFIYS